MTKILNFGLKIKGGGRVVVGRVAHVKSSDPATPQNLKHPPCPIRSLFTTKGGTPSLLRSYKRKAPIFKERT